MHEDKYKRRRYPAKPRAWKSKETQQFIANEVARLSDPYVPMQSGNLKNHRIIANDGSTITYPGPYAHYHWAGEIYGPNIPIGEEGFISRAPKNLQEGR